jgi:PD-(D/E)XK endonuclease
MANTKSIGEISEAIVMAEFLKAGFPVLLPFGDKRSAPSTARPGRQ